MQESVIGFLFLKFFKKIDWSQEEEGEVLRDNLGDAWFFEMYLGAERLVSFKKITM